MNGQLRDAVQSSRAPRANEILETPINDNNSDKSCPKLQQHNEKSRVEPAFENNDTGNKKDRGSDDLLHNKKKNAGRNDSKADDNLGQSSEQELSLNYESDPNPLRLNAEEDVGTRRRCVSAPICSKEEEERRTGYLLERDPQNDADSPRSRINRSTQVGFLGPESNDFLILLVLACLQIH